METLEIRGSSSSRVIWQQAGMAPQQQTQRRCSSSNSSAIQGLSAGSAETAKPYRISDLIPKSWDGSHNKGQFRNFTAELHLRMQAWSDQSERILVRVESVDKVERSTLAVDCTKAGCITFETALYQILRCTTTNEPLRMVQQVQGPRGFEAWHVIVRRYDQRTSANVVVQKTWSDLMTSSGTSSTR